MYPNISNVTKYLNSSELFKYVQHHIENNSFPAYISETSECQLFCVLLPNGPHQELNINLELTKETLK